MKKIVSIILSLTLSCCLFTAQGQPPSEPSYKDTDVFVEEKIFSNAKLGVAERLKKGARPLKTLDF